MQKHFKKQKFKFFIEIILLGISNAFISAYFLCNNTQSQ